MFLNVLHMECDKVFKRMLPWIGMCVVAATFIVYFALLFYGFRSHAPLHGEIFAWPLGAISGSFIVESAVPISSVGVFMLIVVVGSVTGQEYTWRTLHLWLGQGVSRLVLFAAKYAVCVLTVLLVTFVAMLVGLVTSIIGGIQLHGGIDVSRVDLLQWLLAWLRVSYAALPYVTMAFMLAVVTRSAVVSISITLLCAVVLELLLLPLSHLSSVIAAIWRALPFELARSLNTLNFAAVRTTEPHGLYPYPPGDPGLAALGITLYILVFLGIAFWVFCRQNLSE